ncbi:MAG: pyruvate dehydrogenase complex dihydrolipoamide acetyltransferase [Rhodospirillaceae bacterium]|nr:pyruvate dehydrogenase complex dihydrolipoamide acetyltransferase [Rhodospirillaceae bacterium]|tara:strand:+ start:14839 stop:16125 length:1287 start_codon:yes stop_codon:yes gene_type:complete
MPKNILMPALSPTMTEGNVANWLKSEGDSVSPGDLLCEIETDKATMEVECIDEGILGKIVIPAGTEDVPVNTIIGVILEEGEENSELTSNTNSDVKKENTIENNLPKTEDVKNYIKTSEIQSAKSSKHNERILASPLAKRMAAKVNLDLNNITGSGPGGRIVKIDVEKAIATSFAPKESKSEILDNSPMELTKTQTLNSEYKELKLSNMRKVIASRLQASKQQIPHFYLSIDCEVDALLETRKKLNATSKNEKISVNDFIIKASALSIRKFPECNTSWVDGGIIRQYSSIDISVAVAIEDGLVTPIIRNADNIGLSKVSETVRNLAERAREKPMGLLPEEYQGGSFSISNLGMFGVKEFQAVINPPQAMILAVGQANQRPIVKEGALSIANVMTCTLSVDHRVVDGATAAKFLQVIKGYIENPLTMLL